MPRVLLVTNDFPPRPGGIQSFLHGLVSRLPPEDVLVFTSRWRGATAWDATQPYEIVRADTRTLLPTVAVRRRMSELVREHRADTVWFGAAAPLGLLAAAARAAGAGRVVATTHGHEVGWAQLPPTRHLLRRIGREVDVLTYLGDYTRRRLAGAIGPAAAGILHQLTPGVDTGHFRPGAGAGIRDRLQLSGVPVVVCVSRLMPRKGQDVLVRALPEVRRHVPGTTVLLVGGGPSRRRIAALAERVGVADAVRLTGSQPWADLPGYFAAGDVFAMPCRTRLGGLDVEGLGMVFLEAAACGLPVVAGDSGGAPDAVRDGVTGYVVGGRDVAAVSARIIELLRDPERAAAMGAAGRAWVQQRWTWEASVATLTGLLWP